MLITGKCSTGKNITAALAACLSLGMLAPQFGIAQERSNSERANAEQRNEKTNADKNSFERQSQRAKTEQGEQSRETNYLGIQVEPMRMNATHSLPEPFSPGQGLRVVNVVSGSPAEKAGVKTHDIVMCFDDQKIFAPQQLIGLVRGEKTGQEAELTILRNGKTQKINVKVGEREMNLESAASEANRIEQADRLSAENRKSENNADERNENTQSNNRSASRSSGQSAVDDTFDSLSMESTGKNLFKVQIQYLDKSGNLEKHKFEGTLQELRQKIDAERDLPPLERAKLIRSLELPVDMLAVPSVTFRTIPRTNDRDQSDDTF